MDCALLALMQTSAVSRSAWGASEAK
jgi:hypothetical protein